MTVEMALVSRKRKELLMTLHDMLGAIRSQVGCRDCNACLNIENNRVLNLIITWDTQGNLNTYLKSKLYQALLGAIRLLCETHRINFKVITYRDRMESN
jgi:quinol monooxygenase YgiN